MKFKSNIGFTLTDVIVAIAIFMIFSGIIISISYNIYLNSTFVKRNGEATNYIIETFEYAKTLSFEQIETKNLVNYINNKKEKIVAKSEKYSENSEKMEGSYTMFINLDEENIDVEKGNFIKKIDITVMYKLATKTQTVSMSTLINK